MAPRPDQAAELIKELDSLTDDTRSAGRSLMTGLPLVGWGIAWIAGFAALDLLTGPSRIITAGLAWSLGIAASWFPSRRSIRTGSEKRIRVAWFAVLLGSPFLVSAAGVDSLTDGALFLGGLWSLTMCLFALATDDVPYAAISMIGVLMAGLAPIQDWVAPLTLYGLTAGLPLLIIGLRRMLPGRRRA